MVQANRGPPGKLPLKREREREREYEISVSPPLVVVVTIPELRRCFQLNQIRFICKHTETKHLSKYIG